MAVEDSVAQDQLRAFVERVERLDEELKAINDDKKEIYAEAKGNGFGVPALKHVIKLRRQDANERMEREAIVELYMSALGMIATPDFDGPRVRVQAHVREAGNSPAPDHDAETGEITEPQSAPQTARDLAVPNSFGQVAPIQVSTAPKPAPDSEDMTASRIERLPEAKTVAQEPSEAEGSGGVKDGLPVHPATNSQAKASIDGGTTGEAIERPAYSVTGDASRVSVGAGTDAPIQESPRKAAEAEGESPALDDGAFSAVKGNARLENAVGVEPSSSNPIQPATANEVQYPVSRATSERPETASRSGGGDSTVRTARTEASAVTAGETAPMQGALEATEAHNLGQAGSTPAPATSFQAGNTAGAAASAAPVGYAAPGIVVMEHTPPEPMVAHPFAACWPVNHVVAGADDPIREPIVKIGGAILDGRSRFLAARAVQVGPNLTMEYPTVQYGGRDPLADCIRWNMASRTMGEAQLRTVAAKLAKLEPARADEIMDLMGLSEVREAAE